MWVLPSEGTKLVCRHKEILYFPSVNSTLFPVYGKQTHMYARVILGVLLGLRKHILAIKLK